jgi:hypothetical protein
LSLMGMGGWCKYDRGVNGLWVMSYVVSDAVWDCRLVRLR